MHNIQNIFISVIQKKFKKQGELIGKLISSKAVYQFYHYLNEEFGEYLKHFIDIDGDQGAGAGVWNQMVRLPNGIIELLPFLSDIFVFTGWLACYPDLIISNDVEVFGSLIEKEISHWGVQLGMSFEAVRSESLILHVFPFGTEKKQVE